MSEAPHLPAGAAASLPAPGTPPAPAALPRLVLDTNIWLDLHVFADPRCAAIAAALADGSVQVPISRRCLDELRVVVDYAKWDGVIADRPAVVARVEAATVLVEVAPDPALPRCRDPHDQKFVELAVASGARWLVTKDKALLKLAKRLRQRGCEVLKPEQWPGAMAPAGMRAVAAGAEHVAG